MRAFRDRIRYFNKAFTNKVLIRLAGKPKSPFAVLRHIGRKSGRVYEIPVLPVWKGDKFIFALTYGSKVDWYRNILAAKRAEIYWHGREYKLSNPCTVEAGIGLYAFGAFKGLLLRMSGVDEYFEMSAVPSGIISD